MARKRMLSPEMFSGSPMWRRIEVYRLYNDRDELLYVGFSTNLVERLRGHSHKCGQPWWPEVAYCSLEQFSGETEALAAEVSAIKTESPRYNRRSAVAHA